jgi:hypothetical protein
MQVKKITDLAAARAVIESPGLWSLWAVFPRTIIDQHWHVPTVDGIREQDGQFQVNFTGYDFTTRTYQGEDWRTPALVYMRHHCEGCHYPPSMCCASVSGLDGEEHKDEREDALDEAYEALEEQSIEPTSAYTVVELEA